TPTSTYSDMKTGVSNLYPNKIVAERVTEYSQRYSTSLPQHITDYHAWVERNHPRAAYMISDFQGQYLVFLAHSLGAKRILEIGVYAGYSALVWAHAVGDNGIVTGLESSEEYVKMSNDAFEKLGVENVKIVRGDAKKTQVSIKAALRTEEPYDIIFIDAQKSGYPAYLQTILDRSQPGASNRLLRRGGLVVADNVLRRGLVADSTDANPYAARDQTQKHKSEYETDDDLACLQEFNSMVAGSGRIESFLMPLFDGVGLARLVD
ncbi:hypothetical protein QQS21_009766, partial [Conoideocrella luteorostrata]